MPAIQHGLHRTHHHLQLWRRWIHASGQSAVLILHQGWCDCVALKLETKRLKELPAYWTYQAWNIFESQCELEKKATIAILDLPWGRAASDTRLGSMRLNFPYFETQRWLCLPLGLRWIRWWQLILLERCSGNGFYGHVGHRMHSRLHRNPW